jgi:hypothetical protein
MILRNAGADRVDEFRIALVSAGGQALLEVDGKREPFTIPFTRREVEQALDEYSPARLATDPLVSLGSTLFSALFPGEIGRMFWERSAQTERHDRGLRLRILSNLERAQHLPWELLFDPSRGDFMSLSGRLALVRTRPDGFNMMALPPLPRLRILAVEAGPTVGRDIQTLQQFAEASRGPVDLTVLSRSYATPEALAAALGGNEFDLFHFAGTGEVLPYQSKRGGLRQALRLSGSQAAESLVDRHDLGKMLERAGVRLAVLNASHTDWICRSLARYVPSAIGLRERPRDLTCEILCKTLYRSLLSATSLDLAVTACRQALDRSLPGTGEWAKLIFYMQQADGAFLAPGAQSTSRVEMTVSPDENKEVVKLSRLLQVHQQNLDALADASSDLATTSIQKQELEQRIEVIKQQIATIRNPQKGE